MLWNPTIKLLESKTPENVSIRTMCYTNLDQMILGLKDSNVLVKSANPKQKDTLLKGHTRTINSVAVSKTGIIISGSDDTTIKLWDLAKLKNLQTIKSHKEEVTKVDINETKFISSSLDYSIKIFDLKTQKQLSSISDNSPGNTLYFVDENNFYVGFVDGKIRCYDLRDTTKSTSVYSGHEKGVTSLFLHDFGSSIISSSLDNTLKVWSRKKK